MGFLLDIDGTILEAGVEIPGAAATIATLRERGVPFLFATNTSRKSRGAVAASLREAGVPADDDDVLSAGYAAAAYLASEGVRRVQVLMPPDSLEDWRDFEITEEDPEAVVVGDLGEAFDFRTLNVAFRNLHGGATLVAAQKNRFWKAADGWTLDAGAFVAALEYAARVEAIVVGKPAPGFFRQAARLLGHSPSSLTIVGDDVESDVVGGHASGLRTVLVRTGKFDASRLARTPASARPHVVIDSIADLPRLLDS
ncbi:MAG: TIGR01458 family HAD-type hydrolase [bacterium]